MPPDKLNPPKHKGKKKPPSAPIEYARAVLYEKLGWDYWQVSRTPNSEVEMILTKFELDQLKREWDEENEKAKRDAQAAIKSI